MGLSIRVVGQATRRGLVHRMPSPDRLAADVRAWATAEYGQFVRASRIEPLPTGTELALDLHPTADPLSITITGDGLVVASADTSATGPGYHTFVARLLERLGGQLAIEWVREVSSAPEASPAGPLAAGTALAERGPVERAHLAHLARTLSRVGELRRRGGQAIQIGMRPGTYVTCDGAIATPLGPRDDAWLARAMGDARVATDVRPWWADATDARYMLLRALVILWTEIRWRAPADETERAAMDEALRLLRRALPNDPSLPYPWREWAELIALRGVDDPIAERVAPRAERADGTRPLIGYRRRPVTIVHEGWALAVPGTFGERRTAEEWWGGERGRSVTLAAVGTGADGRPMSGEAFLDRVAGNLDGQVLQHRDGELVGKARIGTDASSGLEVAVLEGYSAITGKGAAIRVEFDEPDDWQWAIGLWRSLRPEP